MKIKDDRIFTLTRIIAALVVPFLWFAFYNLYFHPGSSARTFAWEIKPNLTAVYMGAAYLGGSWLFIRTLFGKTWHHTQAGFLAIATFCWFMLGATLLHWERFIQGSLAFTLWVILYSLTPFLVPAIWFYNRRSDPRQQDKNEPVVPTIIRLIIGLTGIATLLFVTIGFILPNILIQAWPWTLTPLTARVVAGWGALLGVGFLQIGAERRWSAYRVPMESILIWQILFFIGMILHRADLASGLVNWFSLVTFGMTGGMLILYAGMEMRRSKLAPSPVAQP